MPDGGKGRFRVGPGFRVCVRTDHHEIESRRACPELVERGRLNLAQDAVLGQHAPWKSPAGTTEKVIGSGILNHGIFLDGSALGIASS